MDEAQFNGANNSGEAFFRCAAVFLPYLNPVELASISLTCNTLCRIAKLVTARRISDASGTLEKVPIPFLNYIPEDSQLYSYFLYAPTQVNPVNPDFRQPWGSDIETQMCNEETRPNPFLRPAFGGIGCTCDNSGEFCDKCRCVECGPVCKCGPRCCKRETQGGISVNLTIVKKKHKNWGLCAAELILKGKFICEYAGEVVSIEEYRRREVSYDLPKSNGRSTPAFFISKEHFPLVDACIWTIIDATRVGNVGRFINHSCSEGNLEVRIVRATGSLLPRVCFYASKEIQKDEELSFSYGSHRKIFLSNALPCFCYSSTCAGVLPSEHPCIEGNRVG